MRSDYRTPLATDYFIQASKIDKKPTGKNHWLPFHFYNELRPYQKCFTYNISKKVILYCASKISMLIKVNWENLVENLLKRAENGSSQIEK